MGLESKLTDDLIRIAAAGGGFRLQASGRLTDDLIRIAAVAGHSGARLYFAGMSSRLIDDLIRIGAAGKGTVVFEE